ncbi:hypothetical protein AB0F17_28700 [Nonomuraea sp. NPDC026600]|uniref:hypothetical protein n=1 Tax=Nonomuraea sp. NPDC026600 TaxID=3155363 RepID=UPI0033D7D36A
MATPWPEGPKPPPRHLRTRRCRNGTCWTCTPHAELRDLLAVGKTIAWRQRLLIILVEAGITTRAQIEVMTDEDLLDIRHVGEGNLAYLRDALAGYVEPVDDDVVQPPADADRLAALIKQAVHRNRGKRALP